jgi:preprotein translocase SecE subunit
MARQTRQERRERRAESTADGGRRTPPPPRPTPGRAAVPDRPEPQHEHPARARRSGGRSFVAESYGELKKVEWPNQKQVITGTLAVLIACLVVGVYLFANDLVWKHVVKWLI